MDCFVFLVLVSLAQPHNPVCGTTETVTVRSIHTIMTSYAVTGISPTTSTFTNVSRNETLVRNSSPNAESVTASIFDISTDETQVMPVKSTPNMSHNGTTFVPSTLAVSDNATLPSHQTPTTSKIETTITEEMMTTTVVYPTPTTPKSTMNDVHPTPTTPNSTMNVQPIPTTPNSTMNDDQPTSTTPNSTMNVQPTPTTPNSTTNDVQPTSTTPNSTMNDVQPTPATAPNSTMNDVQPTPTTPNSTMNVQPTPTTAPNSTMNVQPTPTTPNSTMNNVQPTPTTPNNTMNDVQPTPTTAPNSTMNVQPTPTTSNSTMNDVQPTPTTAPNSTMNVQPTPTTSNSTMNVQSTPTTPNSTMNDVQPTPTTPNSTINDVQPIPTTSNSTMNDVQPTPTTPNSIMNVQPTPTTPNSTMNVQPTPTTPNSIMNVQPTPITPNSTMNVQPTPTTPNSIVHDIKSTGSNSSRTTARPPAPTMLISVTSATIISYTSATPASVDMLASTHSSVSLLSTAHDDMDKVSTSSVLIVRPTTSRLMTTSLKSTNQLSYAPSLQPVEKTSSIWALNTTSVVLVVNNPSTSPVEPTLYTTDGLDKRFDGMATFDLQFTNDLMNPQSKAFDDMKSKFENVFRGVYKNLPGFKHVAVDRFSDGSVIVHYSVFFGKTSNVTEQHLYQAIVKANETGLFDGLHFKGGSISYARPAVKENVFPSWAIVTICLVLVIVFIVAASFVKWKHHRSKPPQSISKREQEFLKDIPLEMFCKIHSMQTLRARVDQSGQC